MEFQNFKTVKKFWIALFIIFNYKKKVIQL